VPQIKTRQSSAWVAPLPSAHESESHTGHPVTTGSDWGWFVYLIRIAKLVVAFSDKVYAIHSNERTQRCAGALSARERNCHGHFMSRERDHVQAGTRWPNNDKVSPPSDFPILHVLKIMGRCPRAAA